MKLFYMLRKTRALRPLREIEDAHLIALEILKLNSTVWTQGVEASWRENMRRAQRFAACWTVHGALSTLAAASIDRGSSLNLAAGQVAHLAIPSTLGCLQILSHVACKQMSLIVEEGPFSRQYFGRIAHRSRISLHPLTSISHSVAALLKSKPATPSLIVTFSDRSLVSYAESELRGSPLGDYYTSQADGLLDELPFDARWRIDARGEGIEREPDDFLIDAWSEKERVQRRNRFHLDAALACIQRTPAEYLGWKQLTSRSLRCRQRVTANGRALLRDFLVCSKMRAFCRDEKSVNELLDSLESVALSR